MSQIDIIEELKKYPEGRTAEELSKSLDITIQGIQAQIGKLRKITNIESKQIGNHNVRYVFVGFREKISKEEHIRKKGKDLEKYACETFVCPNIGDIDIKGNILGLDDNILNLAKDLAKEYFKKTYHHTHFNINNMIPAFIILAGNLTYKNEKRYYIYVWAPGYKKKLATLFNITTKTMEHWTNHVIEVLDIIRGL